LPGATEVIGYWAYAVPSPDGKKVLAMWSGECEVPTTLILDTDTGKGRTAAGEDLSKWNRTTTSTPVGWTSDGLALFAAGPSACGEGRKDAGVFTASPTGRPKLLFRTSEQPEGFIWEREPVAAPLGKAAKDNTIPVELFNEFIERQRPAWSASAEDAAKAFLGPQSADVVTRSVQTRRSSTGDQVSVTDDQRDDSTRSVRTTITFAPGGNTRVRLVDAKVAWRCQPNRGHQDYSTAPCV
jgi:hypothetical protein